MLIGLHLETQWKNVFLKHVMLGKEKIRKNPPGLSFVVSIIFNLFAWRIPLKCCSAWTYNNKISAKAFSCQGRETPKMGRLSLKFSFGHWSFRWWNMETHWLFVTWSSCIKTTDQDALPHTNRKGDVCHWLLDKRQNTDWQQAFFLLHWQIILTTTKHNR